MFGNPELVIVITAGAYDPLHFDEPMIQYKLEELSKGQQIRVFMLTSMECYQR